MYNIAGDMDVLWSELWSRLHISHPLPRKLGNGEFIICFAWSCLVDIGSLAVAKYSFPTV